MKVKESEMNEVKDLKKGEIEEEKIEREGREIDSEGRKMNEAK